VLRESAVTVKRQPHRMRAPKGERTADLSEGTVIDERQPGMRRAPSYESASRVVREHRGTGASAVLRESTELCERGSDGPFVDRLLHLVEERDRGLV
jgi:hypothetical protein